MTAVHIPKDWLGSTKLIATLLFQRDALFDSEFVRRVQFAVEVYDRWQKEKSLTRADEPYHVFEPSYLIRIINGDIAVGS